MNNEWNIHFLPNTSCVEKVSELELYWPRQMWTMTETLIFFKIRVVLKEYQNWSCIYEERNEQWIKRSFSSSPIYFQENNFSQTWHAFRNSRSSDSSICRSASRNMLLSWAAEFHYCLLVLLLSHIFNWLKRKIIRSFVGISIESFPLASTCVSIKTADRKVSMLLH